MTDSFDRFDLKKFLRSSDGPNEDLPSVFQFHFPSSQQFQTFQNYFQT